MLAVLAALTDSDLHTVLVVLAILCLIGAGVAAWRRMFEVTVALLIVAVVCFLVAD